MENLTINEKIRLFEGEGSWNTFSCNKKLSSITMSDGPHGLRKQDQETYSDINDSKIATCFPTASCSACSWDEKLLTLMGKAIAHECIKENVNLLLGPGLNIKRSPLCGRNFEYFSEDPYLSGKMAAAFVNGVQSQKVGACIKHFACNNQEKKRQSSSSNIDTRTLHELYLRGFEIAVKESQPCSVMCSYNKINGVYSSKNKELLTTTLRDKWNFNGFVVSDWGACINASESLKAGLDLAMPDSSGYITNQLTKAFNNAQISEADLDKANSRIFAALERTKAPETEKSELSSYEASLKVLEGSVVLLKNENFLPLNCKKIILIGNLAKNVRFQGGGSSHVNTVKHLNVIEELEKNNFEVLYSDGYSKKENLEEVKKLAQQSKAENIPVLFFYGLDDKQEGEGFDRTCLKVAELMSECAKVLAENTSNAALISVSGSPIDFPPLQNFKAILQMYLAGEAFSEGLVNILTGKVNPSGRLAESWITSETLSEYPHLVPKDQKQIQYEEREFCGYRFYLNKKEKTAFPFGFGLSYTTFEYSGLKIEKEKDDYFVSFTLKNTGKYDGAEVCQIYAALKESVTDVMCVNQLRGFTKVFLKAGEEETVKIQLDKNTFKTFDVNAMDFVPVSGIYRIMAGKSCEEAVLETEIKINEGKNLNQIELNPPIPSFSEENEKFTMESSLSEMAAKSFLIRLLVKFMKNYIYKQNKNLSKDDPAVKISIAGLLENPVESLISTSNGSISEKFARFLVRTANH